MLPGSSRSVRRTRADVVIRGQTGVMLNFRLAFRRDKYVLSNWTTMSEILMKEMESISISPIKGALEGRPDGVPSFLLVDEQENLQVKLATSTELTAANI